MQPTHLLACLGFTAVLLGYLAGRVIARSRLKDRLRDRITEPIKPARGEL